jgi:predicted SAM-dependent methyltransferase
MNFTKSKIILRRLISSIGIHAVKIKYSKWHYELYGENQIPKEPRYVNLGAGAFYHPYWHNVDMPNDFYKDQQDNLHLTHDFTDKKQMPFDTKSIETFYCSHVIEHLNDEDVKNLMKEVYRSLENGGVFRITCPDMELQYKAYQNSDYRFWMNLRPWGPINNTMEHLLVENFATCIANKNKFPEYFIDEKEIREIYKNKEMKNFFNEISEKIPPKMNSIYPEGHINWFTVDKISEFLKEVGFQKINRSGYLQSSKPYMRDPRFFDSTCPELSLYIEAIK